MRITVVCKRLLWIMLVILASMLMIWRFQIASESVRIYQEPTASYYISLGWEILKELTILMPIWLLSLLGLARSFFGENWLPFSEMIPVCVTKIILATSALLLVGISVAGAVYSIYTEDSYVTQHMMENRFEAWKTMLAWLLFYGILLYIEQWCIRRNCSRQYIRKIQAWVAVTSFLTLIILFELSCVDLWYIPLSHVGSPNTLEDYYLWWFSLYSAVFILPLWFFSARKTVRLFMNNEQWLTLSAIISKKITVVIVLMFTGMMVWQVQECRSRSAWIPFSEVPEYTEAAVMAHLFQAMIWGLALFYMVCLLVKQIRATRRAKCKP